MWILFAIYIPFLLLVTAYVVVNAYHLISFQLRLKGDLSPVLLTVYLIVVVGLVGGSIMMGTLAYFGTI
jgi:hypothetical protein